MDMPDVHHIAIYDDLIAAKVQGRRSALGTPWSVSSLGNASGSGDLCTQTLAERHYSMAGTIDECFS